MSRYRVLAAILLSGGAALATYSYISLESEPLIAAGMALLIVGLSSAFLGGEKQPLPGNALRAPGGMSPQAAVLAKNMSAASNRTLTTESKFLLVLATSMAAVTALVAAAGLRDLDLYFVIYASVFMITTLGFRRLRPRVRTAFNAIGFLMFAGFLVMMVLKVLQMSL